MQKTHRIPDNLPFEFHISRAAREKYAMSDTLFGNDGRVIFADFRAVREFVFNINKTRNPEDHVYPGEVNAAGLLDEIFHLLVRSYEEQVNPGVISKLQQHLMRSPFAPRVRALLRDFIDKFPPAIVYRGNVPPLNYLEGFTGIRTNMAISLEEAMMLHLANSNPANKKLKELFDTSGLNDPAFFDIFSAKLADFFKAEPPFSPGNKDIYTLLREPLEAAPSDLYAQLEYILTHWKSILPEHITLKILKSQDLMKEDVRLSGGPGGHAPTLAPVYKGTPDDGDGLSFGKSGYRYALDAVKDYEEYERFTSDSDWMPHVVMMAKNTWVWLDQLSKQYQREIRRLDQVPDEELDRLAAWHVNGLWLIGVWERSVASKRIKHIMGNIDAVSSAYSLYDYEIAADLGGEEAFRELDRRARARGIRLAGDMVPNHTGIFSRWIVDRPDYFIQAEHPPFPGYRFTGENLSPDQAVQLRLEDGYYSQQDAAVVFQHINNHTGQIRYIYHGNDGTMMPWNDTAQLDFLKQEVREAVIQKIFDVARMFSIIRFDAAMTLAKKHFARLWYPRPGTGGDIASRADYAIPQQVFDDFFPEEFWREVVDRMNQELPNTLLLAEAFWFMEGYFVRTLGMHRVYNSAFMHMLKNEENEKYRDLITNTLEFEPEILKRYVNFMSNPDEETAIRQFGTGDKYFGICVLMTTLPGLPMFGHGQVEGYTEKYGMEYQRAYYNETPEQWLVEKHEREIFPLTAKRYLFSEITHFNFFDFIDQHGHLNENVMAYTNMHGQERSLVLFNNKYDGATGHIFHSAPKLSKETSAAQTMRLGDALQLNPTENTYYIFREHISGLEYLRTGHELFHKGFHWGLQGFEYRVFIDFREVYDKDGLFGKLHASLGDNGCRNMQELLDTMRLQDVHQAFAAMFAEKSIQALIHNILNQKEKDTGSQDAVPVIHAFNVFAETARNHAKLAAEGVPASEDFRSSIESASSAIRFLATNRRAIDVFLKRNHVTSIENLLMAGSEHLYRDNLIFLLACIAIKALRKAKGIEILPGNPAEALMLHYPLKLILEKSGRDKQGVYEDMTLLKILTEIEESVLFSVVTEPTPSATPHQQMSLLLDHPLVNAYLRVNLHEGIWYYSKESFEDLLRWSFTLAFFEAFKSGGEPKQAALEHAVKYLLQLKKLSERAGYQLVRLKEMLG